MRKLLLLATAATALGAGSQALAAEHQVKMLNSGPDGVMVFEPGFLKVAKGDTVTFLPTEPAHNSVSHYGPDGGQSWKGGMNQPVSVTFDTEGVYLYKCEPHVPLGMVAVIQVGEATNLAAAKDAAASFMSSIAVNKERLDKYLNQIN